MSREVALTAPGTGIGIATIDSDVTSNSGPTGAVASSDVDLSQLRRDGNPSVAMESISNADTINADDFEEEDEDIAANVAKNDKYYQGSVQRLMGEIDVINEKIGKLEKFEHDDDHAVQQIKKLKEEKEERRRLLDLAMNEQQKALEKEELARDEEKMSVLDCDSNTRIHRSGRTFYTGNNNNNNNNLPVSVAPVRQKQKQKQKEKEKVNSNVREPSRTVGNLLRAVNAQPHMNLGGNIEAECKDFSNNDNLTGRSKRVSFGMFRNGMSNIDTSNGRKANLNSNSNSNCNSNSNLRDSNSNSNNNNSNQKESNNNGSGSSGNLPNQRKSCNNAASGSNGNNSNRINRSGADWNGTGVFNQYQSGNGSLGAFNPARAGIFGFNQLGSGFNNYGATRGAGYSSCTQFRPYDFGTSYVFKVNILSVTCVCLLVCFVSKIMFHLSLFLLILFLKSFSFSVLNLCLKFCFLFFHLSN